MIKKIFVGVLLAGAFVLLVFGAVNRTFAKTTDQEPLAINKNLSAGSSGTNGSGNQNKDFTRGANDCFTDVEKQGQEGGVRRGDGDDDCESSLNGSENKPGGGYDQTGSGAGPNEDARDGDGTGQATIEEWITYYGVIETATSDVWVIALENDTTLELEGRVLSYMMEQGFAVNEGDALILTGFYDGGDFEVGEIENTTTGESVMVRNEDGRPLWAGGHHGGWDH